LFSQDTATSYAIDAGKNRLNMKVRSLSRSFLSAKENQEIAVIYQRLNKIAGIRNILITLK
jgi:hypothetical protein